MLENGLIVMQDDPALDVFGKFDIEAIAPFRAIWKQLHHSEQYGSDSII